MQYYICISQFNCFLFSNCVQLRHARVKLPRSQIINPMCIQDAELTYRILQMCITPLMVIYKLFSASGLKTCVIKFSD